MSEDNDVDMVNCNRAEENQFEQRERKLVRWRSVQQIQGKPVPRPRHGHRAIVVKDLIVIMGGGNEGMINETTVFNTATNEWVAPQLKGDKLAPAAAFGALVLGTRIYTFGGMEEYGKYTNQLAEFNVTRWEHRILRTLGDLPCPRLGHTFVACQKTKKAYVFGGLANDLNDTKKNLPRYLNDIFVIDLSAKQDLVWEKLTTHGTLPEARESHTAVVYETETVRRMIVYGGMNGVRLGDLWYLDLDTLKWTEITFDDPRRGIPPMPRSLHTAVLIDEKMYIYGGWVPVSESNGEQLEKEWKCTNNLACWDISAERWESLHLFSYDEDSIPRGRAGHCSAAVGHRMYMWSGRDGYRKAWSNQVCCRDMWLLDTIKPAQPERISLGRAGFQSLEIAWPAVSGADTYFLQIGFGDSKDQMSPTKNSQSSPRKDLQKNDEKSSQEQAGPSSSSLISTQGTTYTAPVAVKPAVDEGGLPQDLFDDAEKNETINPPEESESVADNGESSKKEEAEAKEEEEKPSEEELTAVPVDDEDDLLPWFDVGLIKEAAINVTHYFNSEREPRLEEQLSVLIDQMATKCINDQGYTPEDKVPLLTGQTYRFRVCAINGLGRGPWSEISEFKTCQPGFPSAPSSIRITKSLEGAQLTWEPPSNANIAGKIVEYSVYLAVKNQSATAAGSQLAFMRVYCGPTAECQVPQANLGTAYVDQTNKPAIIFRIAARNEKGYGPATQVRWLQDQQKMPNPAPQQKRPRFDPQ
uniref:Fibronectin type-III domain-containing protein n=1 Tax=Caenorhabditis japonica TaxID=281687 RepID=A0A8R1HQ67_CAEJA